MTINDVLFFDTETTGVPGRNARWDEDFMDYPHIVSIAWMFGDVAESHIIRPEGWEIPEEVTKIHGISTEYAQEHGEPFALVIDRFLAFAAKAGLLCGHNIHFDTGIVKANILRELGHEYYDAEDVEGALYKGKRIDTMRPTMKWVDARMADGRPKFPNLSELYARCFPGETFPAHDALEDVKAVARCLPVILEQGLVELKLKEYPAEQLAIEFPPKTDTPLKKAVEGPILSVKQKDDKLPIRSEKGPQNENFAKITENVVAALLEENDF